MNLNMERRTVVIVTLEPEIAKYADRVILAKDGMIEYN
jgi:putative ABC transport system ATP-binding protein